MELWGVSLCGPIMFVDPQSRSIVASVAPAVKTSDARNSMMRDPTHG